MFEYVFWCVAGALFGTIVGVIPMAGATIGLLMVFSFADQFLANPYLGVVFMTALIAATGTSDSFTSILTGIPGSNTSAASIIDGYPMAKNGQGGRAIGIAILDSTVNGLFWGALAFGLMPFYSGVILYFGIPEFAAFMALSLAAVGFITTRNVWLSVASLALGLFVGMIGQDPATGAHRYTFGWDYLAAGVQIIPVIAGLFAAPALWDGLTKRSNRVQPVTDYWQQVFQGFKDVWTYRRDVARGGVIGFVTGLLPGVGGSVGDLIAYGATVAKHPNEKFGNGNPRGLLGCEGANNAQKPASLIPTLLFGIPAAPFAVMMMAICLTLGLELGSPHLLQDDVFVKSMALAFMVSTILTFFVCLFTAKIIVWVLRTPYWIYAIGIGSVCVWSAWQYSGTVNDLYILAICSVIGVASVKIGLSRPAILIAYILGPKLENYTQQMMMLYTWPEVFSRPLFSFLIFSAVALIGWSMLRKNKGIDYS